MKMFELTYRDESGALKVERLEVASRAAAIQAFKQRGLVPTSVRKCSAREVAAVRPIAWKKGAVAGALIVIAAALAWVFGSKMQSRPASPEPEVAPKPIVKAKPVERPAPDPKAIPEDGMVEIYRGGEMVKVKKTAGDGWYYYRDSDGNLRRTNNRKTILALQPSVNQDEVRAVMKQREEEAKKPQPPKRYANRTHAQLAQYVVAGRNMPPPDPISDAEALKACDAAIKYLDSDSDETLDEKKTVEEMAQQLKEYIKNGGHANDYFSELSRRQELEAEAVTEARSQVRQLCLEGKPDEAEAAMKAFNKYLKEKGIPEVNMSGSIERARKRGGPVRKFAK